MENVSQSEIPLDLKNTENFTILNDCYVELQQSSVAFRREITYLQINLIFSLIIVKRAELQTHIAVQQPEKKGKVSFSLTHSQIYSVLNDSKEKVKRKKSLMVILVC